MPRRQDAQLGLFGESPPAAAPAPDPELVALGAALRARPVYLGTSSWSFPGWAGLVYPPGLDTTTLAATGLRWYAQHPLLRAVGIDRSYYGPLTAADYRAYADQVPADFRFIAKAERTITTPPAQLPAGYGAADGAWLDGARLRRVCIEPLLAGLGPGRAGLVLQFPPLRAADRRDPAAFVGALAGLLRDLPTGIDYFVELRNRELITPDYAALLRATGVAHCYSVHPGAPPLADQAAVLGSDAPGTLLVRWNLQRDRVYEEARAEFAPFNRLVAPDPATRAAVVTLVAGALAAGRPAFVLANNKAEGSAPLTMVAVARALAARLALVAGAKPA